MRQTPDTILWHPETGIPMVMTPNAGLCVLESHPRYHDILSAYCHDNLLRVREQRPRIIELQKALKAAKSRMYAAKAKAAKAQVYAKAP